MNEPGNERTETTRKAPESAEEAPEPPAADGANDGERAASKRTRAKRRDLTIELYDSDVIASW